MHELRQFYRTALRIMAILIGFLAVGVRWLVVLLQQQYGANNVTAQILGFVVSGGAIGLLFLGGESLIRKKLWKVLHKPLDYDGRWKGTTTYTKLERGTAGIRPEDHEEFSVQHEVRIEQDCLSIRLAPAVGTEFVNWSSLAMDLVGADKLCYAYEVKYTGRPRFPATTFGYEEMSATDYDRSGRPSRLTGIFSHCTGGDGPRYSGRVEFERVEKGEKATAEMPSPKPPMVPAPVEPRAAASPPAEPEPATGSDPATPAGAIHEDSHASKRK